jgi:hypothetical protein
MSALTEDQYVLRSWDIDMRQTNGLATNLGCTLNIPLSENSGGRR